MLETEKNVISQDIIDNTIFWQCLIDQLILVLGTPENHTAKQKPGIRILTKIEENAIRYTGGFVIRKVISSFKKKHLCIEQLLGLLLDDELLEEGESLPEDYSKVWIEKVDSGRLHHISRTCFELFCEKIEITSYQLLKDLFAGHSKETANNIERITMEDPDVTRIWAFCSLDMETSEAQEALKLIIHFWVMARGSSLRMQYMNEYKSKTNKKTKQKSLRKEMKQS